jgi:hypothetical protein
MSKLKGSYILLLCLSTTVFSQVKDNQSEGEKAGQATGYTSFFSEGSVLLKNDTQLTGLLRFDENSNVLSYENANDFKNLEARSCLGFEFFDEEQQKQRVFYVFQYEDESNPKKHYFFEVLKQFNNFTVLSKVEPAKVKISSVDSGSLGPNSPPPTVFVSKVSQLETVFIMDAGGVTKPYAKLVKVETNSAGADFKDRFFDESLLKRYTQAHYALLQQFANRNNLNFSRKEDLIKILNEYEQLLSK